jgi:ABC-2 type transport system permease protein
VIRALLLRQLRHQRALLAAVWIGLAALEWLLVIVVARIEMGPGVRALFEQFLPPAIRVLFAAQLGSASFGGLVAFGFTHPAVLVAAIGFVVVLATLPAGERESGILELILSRPVPRARYLVAVLLLVVVAAVVLPLALLAGAALGLHQVDNPDELPWTRYVHASAGLTCLLLAIGGYTLYFASGAARRGRPVALAVGWTVALMWIEILAQLWAPLERVRWISPFHYYDPMGYVVAGGAPLAHTLVLLGVFVVATAAAFDRFRRQDL